jgi:hypothetical protein
MLGIRVRDDDVGVNLLAVLENDAGHATIVHENAPDRAVEKQLPAFPLQRGDDRVDEPLEAAAAVVGALFDVAHQHHREVEEGEPGRRESEIRPQARQHGHRSRIRDLRAGHVGKRRFVMPRERRPTKRHAQEIERTRLRRH